MDKELTTLNEIIATHTEPMTLDEIIAKHGGRIVHVQFSLDSDFVICPTLEIVVQDKHCQRLRYARVEDKWILDKYSLDYTEYVADPDDVNSIAKVLKFAGKAL